MEQSTSRVEEPSLVGRLDIRGHRQPGSLAAYSEIDTSGAELMYQANNTATNIACHTAAIHAIQHRSQQHNIYFDGHIENSDQTTDTISKTIGISEIECREIHQDTHQDTPTNLSYENNQIITNEDVSEHLIATNANRADDLNKNINLVKEENVDTSTQRNNQIKLQAHVCDKSVEPASVETSPSNSQQQPDEGNHRLYRCGACSRQFPTICLLHQHLQQHSQGGSYHYDHAIQTAFPKYDTCCSATQTRKEDLLGQGKRKCYKPSRYHEPTTVNDEVAAVIPKSEVAEDTNNWADLKPEPDVSTKTDCHSAENYVAEVVDELHDYDSGEEYKIKKQRRKKKIIGRGVRLKLKKILHKTKRKYNHNAVKRPKRTDDSETKPDDETKHLAEKPDIKPQPYMKSPLKLPDGSKMTCLFCDKMFQYSKGLRRHESLFHAQEMKFLCDICNCKFMRLEDLHNHKLRCHIIGKNRKYRKRAKDMVDAGMIHITQSKTKLSTAAMNCEICGITLPEYKFEVHTRIHTGERPFICEICGKGLISEKKLKRHLLIHSSIKPFNCDMCPRAFISKYKLRLHLNTHTGTKPFLCTICGAKFNHNSNLSTHHKVVHLGEKPHTCEMCPAKFGKKQQLKDHMVSHTTERKLACRICGNMFKSEKGLKRHEKIHTQEKAFVCDSCGSAFSRNDNLQRHRLTHAEATFECSLCRRMFKDEKQLSEHHRRTHQDQTGNENDTIKAVKAQKLDHTSSPTVPMTRTYSCVICSEMFLQLDMYYTHLLHVHQMDRQQASTLMTDTLMDVHFVPGNAETDVSMPDQHPGMSIAMPQASTVVSTVGMSAPDNASISSIMSRDSSMSHEQTAAVLALTSLGHRERSSVLNIPSRDGIHSSLDMSANNVPSRKPSDVMTFPGDHTSMEIPMRQQMQMALAFTGIQNRDTTNQMNLQLGTLNNEGINMFIGPHKNTGPVAMMPMAGIRPEGMDIFTGGLKTSMPGREHTPMVASTSIPGQESSIMMPLNTVPSIAHHYANRDSIVGTQLGRYFDSLTGPHN